jgi:hypothetical protein
LTHKGAYIWLGGDFNLPGIDWQNENIKLNSQHTVKCHQLLDISNNAFLYLLVLEPTRIANFLIGLRLDSINIASWSDMPGITRTWLTKVLLFVKKIDLEYWTEFL